MTLIRTRHTISGQIAYVDDSMLDHPVLGKHIEEVGEDAKPFVPGLFRAGTVAERKKSVTSDTDSTDAKRDGEKDH